MLEKIHVFITFIAVLVVALASLAMRVDLFTMSVRLIYTIIGFYIFGLVIRYYLKAHVFNGDRDDQTDAVLDEAAKEGSTEPEPEEAEVEMQNV